MEVTTSSDLEQQVFPLPGTDDLVEFLEDALENLNFTEEFNKFELLTLDEDDELDEDK